MTEPEQPPGSTPAPDDPGTQPQPAQSQPAPPQAAPPQAAYPAQPRPDRGRQVRRVLTSRGAGWVVAAVLAGAVVALAVTEATAQPAFVGMGVPFAAPGNVRLHISQAKLPPGAGGRVFVGPPGQVVIGPAGRVAQIVPGGPVQVGPGGPVQVSPGGQVAVGPGGAGSWRVVPFPGLRPSGARLMTPFGQVVAGTVGSVSGSSFTVTAPGGQPVTVNEQSSTVYRKAGSPAAASAVTRGVSVAVLGTPSGSAISAIEVAVLPAGAGFNAGLAG